MAGVDLKYYRKKKSSDEKWVGVGKERENEGKAKLRNKNFKVKEVIRLAHQQKSE